MDDRIHRLAAAFRDRFGRNPDCVAVAPGRVNLIGEHTDYNDGFVLPAAIDRAVLVAASACRASGVVWSLDLDRETTDPLQPQKSSTEPWINYIRGCAAALSRAGHPIRQVDLAVQSNVPIGAGLSSSAALEVAATAAIAATNGIHLDPLELAVLAHRAETEFVGVPCGIMDQFVSALAMEDHALLIDCRSREATPVPMALEGAGLALVVVDSGVGRELAASAYRERRAECEEAVRTLGRRLGKPVEKLRDVTSDDLRSSGHVLTSTLLKRSRHVVSENERVIDFVAALTCGRMDEAGDLLAQSHRSLRDDYEVSSPELDLLVELAGPERGVVGARLTGAGFGGCTVNLVHLDALARFQRDVVEEYAHRTGRPAKMHVCRVVGGARVQAI